MQLDGNEVSDEDIDDYYGPDDLIDEAPEEVVKEKKKEPDDGLSADKFFTGEGTPMAVQRLLLDLRNMNTIGTK